MEISPWIIVAITTTAVYFLDRFENRYIKSLFDWFPALLFSYIIPAVISAIFDLNLSSGSIHNFSRDFLVPLAIVTVMSSLSINQLKNIGWKPIVVFVSGSFWIAIFPALFIGMFKDVPWVHNTLIQGQFWKGIPPIVGSWVGGSTSQMVLKEMVACPESIFLVMLVFDSLLVNFWTIIMFQSIKKSSALNKFFGINSADIPMDINKKNRNPLHPFYVIITLIVLVLMVYFVLDVLIVKVVVLSVIGLILSNLIKNWNHTFVLKVGGILILLIMSILGLKLSFDNFSINLPLLGFLAMWLISHFVIMLIMAKILNVNTAWVSIGSMANVGGIATAPAVTAAYEKKWMPHAIILAILSMVTGTFWGMVTIGLLGYLGMR